MNKKCKIIRFRKYYIRQQMKEWRIAFKEALKEVKEVTKNGFKK